jgi:fused signal recognition particle receptor
MPRFDDSLYESVEEALIAADIGMEMSQDIVAHLTERITREGAVKTAEDAWDVLKSILIEDLSSAAKQIAPAAKPWVIFIVGVNGVGKTTTIGKICKEYTQQGKSVLLGAADTFRAGAIEQLRIWSERAGADFVSQQAGADAASVAFDALQAANSRGTDIVILDTAGRLHNKVNLMNELEKMMRVIKRQMPDAPHEVLLVIDATTGQNAIKQAEVFNSVIGLSGLIITKLDGTAKGGIAFALTRKLKLPIRKIGVGEAIEDLQDFDPAGYVEAMFGKLNP